MALPATPEACAEAWRHMRRFLREQEAEHHRLLSMWVSELEPEFVYTRTSMAVMGITVKGWRDVVIYAKGWTRSAQISHDLWMTWTSNPVREQGHWPENYYSGRRNISRDFVWSSGVDLAVEAPDRTVRTVQASDLKISFSIETKDIDPALFKKMLQVTMPKVKK